jgi:hypothetical protein
LGNQTLLEHGLSRFQTIFKTQNISFDTETELALKNTLVAKKEKNRRHYYYGIPTITCRITEK